MKIELSRFELFYTLCVLFSFIIALCLLCYNRGFENGQTDAIANMYRMLIELMN